MNPLRLTLLALAVPIAVGLLVPACGSEPAEITFEGEDPLFPGFEYTTGLQPAGSPVQASFTVSASGVSRVRADAAASGSDDEPVLTGLPDTGSLTIEGGFGLVGQLVVDVSGLPSYDGPIPGIDNVEIPFSATTEFDPFAIGESVSAKADIPPSKLPGIPLPGGLPGQLVLEIAEGSFVGVSFSGSCAGIDGDEASYLGNLERSGALVIKPSVEIEIPILGTQTFEIPSFTVDLALGSSTLRMTEDVRELGAEPDDGDRVDGSCDVHGSGAGGASSGGGASVGGMGAGGSAGGTAGGHATVEVDGAPMTVTGIDLWPAGDVDANTHLFIAFEGIGFDAGSDVALDIVAVGSGCAFGNDLWLRPNLFNASYPDQYHTDSTLACGLEVDAVPAEAGQSLVGSFNGWLDALQGGTPPQAHVSVTFDVPGP